MNTLSTLRSLLTEWKTKLEIKHTVMICWADSSAFKSLYGFEAWAGVERVEPGVYVIGVDKEIQHAPTYVASLLVLHELMHIKLPARGGVWGHANKAKWHHRAFRVAEMMHPSYTEGNVWLWRHR